MFLILKASAVWMSAWWLMGLMAWVMMLSVDSGVVATQSRHHEQPPQHIPDSQ